MDKPTVKQIEEYMAALNVPAETSANAKQVSGKHYKEKTIQPWDYIYANNLGYFEGNCVKYVSRWRDKGGIADLQKAIHYLEKLIELENNKQ
jgi:hypothetical protein